MRFLFVMDPYAGMLPDKDTSFAFMRASLARGHEVLHCRPEELFNESGRVGARARPLVVSDRAPHVTAGEPRTEQLAELDAVLIRKDPPFDSAYLYMTQQLDLVKDQVLVLNDPSAIRDANEKLYALRFPEFMPPTLVSADERQLIDFVAQVGGRAVIKPLDGAGGMGVAFLGSSDVNLRPLVGLLTQEGRRLAMVQEFQPSVVEGDKRVLLLDGRVLGVIRRVPRDGDIRANIHVGGRVVATDLTAGEREMAEAVGAKLRSVGLWFVGLDVINGKLIEINVTSPTGIQELGRLTNTRPEQAVVEWIEARVRNGA
ncbi:MAG TPA: glutathione synthase [Polyangiaceae bacterium]|nr:glutathione synthase [Polyangiaceae bacterium]